MELPGRAHAKSWEGQEVLDLTGLPLGRCVGVFADADTEMVEWLLVDVTGHRRSFVPAVDVVEEPAGVRLSFVRDQVLAAPSVGDAEQLSKRDEMTLYRHYDVPFTDDASESLLPEDVVVADDGAGTAPAQADADATPAASMRMTPGVPPLIAPEPFGTPVPDTALDPMSPAASLPPPAVLPPPVQTEPPPAPTPVVAEVKEQVIEEQVVVAPAVTSGTSRDDDSPATLDRTPADALSAAAPLAAVGAAVAAVWLVLRGLDRRAARRRSLPARTHRARRQVSRTGRDTAAQLSATLAAASTTAERHGRRTAKAAAQRRKEAAEQRVKAVKAAEKNRKKTVKAAQARRKQTGEAASKHRRQALKAAVQRRDRGQKGLAAATTAVATGASYAADRVTAVPGAVADRAGHVRRSVASTLWDVATAAAAAGGYVLGARAGRERYEQITELAAATAARPEVQTAKQAVVDSEHRTEAVESLKDQGKQLLIRVRVLPG
ncbi:hypothetical protein BH24ACT10_BH24ACT10_10660 [soil metagenome]